MGIRNITGNSFSLWIFICILHPIVTGIHGETLDSIAAKRIPRSAALGDGRIMVYAPHTLKTDAVYKIIARQFLGSDDLSVFAKIKAQRNGNTESITIAENGGSLTKSGAVTEIDLTPLVDALKQTSNHELEIEVEDPASRRKLTKSWHITYHDKEVFVLIQPDKSVYRPGDRVTFRVVTIDENLIPKDASASVSVQDSNRKNVRVDKQISKKFHEYPGYFEDSFAIPLSAPTGNWSIKVTVYDTMEEKLIWVHKYEPKHFDVSLQTPQYILADASHFQVAVLAKYFSSGRPSSGDATFAVTGPNGRTIHITAQLVNGKGTVSVPIPDLLSNAELNPTSTYYIEISADITDSIYRHKRTTSGTIPLHVTPYKISFIRSANFFRPNHTYSLQVQVTQHNGKLLNFDRTLHVEKELEVFMGPDKTVKGRPFGRKKSTVNGDKVLENFTMELPTRAATRRIDVFYQIGILRENITILAAERSETRDFIDITVPKPNRLNTLDRLQEFSIMCNCASFDYVVIAHGNIILAGTHFAEEAKLAFETVDAMAPKATLIAYYFNTAQHPVMAYTDFHVNRFGMTEEVILNATWKSKSRDNQHRYSDIDKTISIHASALPGSLVAFLAVDTRLATVDHVHNITEDKVINKILRARHAGFTSMDRKRTNGANLSNFLKISGCIVHVFNFSASEESNELIQRAPSYPRTESVLPRMDFRDSFLFITGRANDDGDVKLDTIIPDTLTTWVFTAFSISPEGIGFMKKATELSARQNLHVEFDLPHSAVVGEPASFRVYVFNHAATNEHAVLESRFALNNRTLGEYANSVDFHVYANNVNSTLMALPTQRTGILEVAVTVRTMDNLDPVIKTMIITNSDSDNSVIIAH